MRIEQVLTNLLDNALKYSSAPTKVSVLVRGVACDSPCQRVVIAIRDQGYGISREHLPHVFERFYRVRPSDGGAIEGAGLGLYVAAEIVRRHGGDIWVESVVEEGSTFFVSLPLV
jgi:signal transduction histidine kinase